MHCRLLNRRWPALALALLIALACAEAAWAHPQILAIEPPPGAQLDRPPIQLHMRFNEPIEALSRLALFDAQGQLRAEGGTLAPADPAQIALDLPVLDAGLYTVVWTVAGSDGHIVRGNFAFTVRAASAAGPTAAADQALATPSPAPAAAPAPAESPPPPPFPTQQALARWLLLLGATAAVGGWVFWLGVVQPTFAPGQPPNPAVRRWRGWTIALLLFALLGGMLTLADTAAALLGRLDPAAVGSVALSTRGGRLLLARMGLALGLLALALTLRADSAPGRIRTGLALTLSGLLLLAQALAGHAGAGAAPLLPVLTLWAHLVAASAWTGGLLLFAVTLGPLLRGQPAERRAALLAGLVRRFSALALGSVALLAASGTLAALREIQRPADLWQTAYGLALLAKLALFGGLLALGAYHLLVVRPALGRARAESQRGPQRFGRSLRAEAGLVPPVLLAAAILASLPPPAARPAPPSAAQPTPAPILLPTVTPGPPRTPVPSQPFDQTQEQADLRVRLRIEPASIGTNQFRVTVTDRAGQPVATQLVRLTFDMLTMDMGVSHIAAEPTGASSFVVRGSPLSMVGDWQVRVLVRRASAADVEVLFSVPVGE